MSQFLGQTYSLPPPGQLQMMYASSVASAPSINSNRLFGHSPVPNEADLQVFGGYAPVSEVPSYQVSLNPPASAPTYQPLPTNTQPLSAIGTVEMTTTSRSKKGSAPRQATRVSHRKRTVAKPKTTVSASAVATTGRGKGRKDIANSNPIIKKQIADAINSKPQRGRKRSNLTDEERQELTRTRNRQHAKSTRERKKARLEELTKIEEQHNELLHTNHMEAERRRVVQAVISSRGQPDPVPFIAHNPPVIDMEGNPVVVDRGGFEDCFDDPVNFTFKRPGKSIRGLGDLAKDNAQLLKAITDNFDEKAAKSLTCSVYGGEQGVAIARDFAFGQWEIKTITNATSLAQTIAAGFFKVTFRSGLPKLLELEFSVDDAQMAVSADGNFEQLPSFPSVSSFPTMNLSENNFMLQSGSTGSLRLSSTSLGLTSFSSQGQLGGLPQSALSPPKAEERRV